MIDWESYTLIAQIIGGILGIAYAYALNYWFERKDRIREKKELEEYKKFLEKTYKNNG